MVREGGGERDGSQGTGRLRVTTVIKGGCGVKKRLRVNIKFFNLDRQHNRMVRKKILVYTFSKTFF